ncbi:MAG: HPr family phosphocarrier protein [Ruminococcus sp.]|nr:HPr family phosphocarrier protein [Ruminococcus sp.]
MKSTISINNVEQARQFVEMTSRFPKIRLMLHEGDYDIDAHSIIGILSLDLTQPIELLADGEITEEFLTALAPFTV